MVKVTSIEQALKGTLSKGKTAPKKASKTPSFYPADDAKFPLKRAAVVKNQTKLRASITPGTILILLAGHFKGKRVIFLRQLDSGLLLVCGPYGVNGVPVKRVNQCYVIATSTKIDVAGVRVVFP
jgi:large subunit ribosomal protein L6e